MTIEDTNLRIAFDGDGVTTGFSYNFRILASADLMVVLQNSAGVDAVQVETTNYTVAGVADAGGGLVTMIVPPANNEVLAIVLNPLVKQTLDLTNAGVFPSQAVEDAFDRSLNIIKRDRDLVSRAMVLVEADTDGSGRFDANSNRIINLAAPVGATDAPDQAFVNAQIAAATLDLETVVSSFSATMLAAISAATWLDTLVPNQAAYDDWLDSLLYDQGGTGAVPYGVRARLQNEVWAEDYGASPSATGAVNVAAINAAIDALTGAGGVLRIGAGVFTLDLSTSDYAINMKRKVHFQGSGIGLSPLSGGGSPSPGTILKLANTQNAHVIRYGAAQAQATSITNMVIDGNRPNQTTAKNGIEVNSVIQTCLFNNLVISNVYGTGIRLSGGANDSNFMISNCEFNNLGSSGIDLQDQLGLVRGTQLNNLKFHIWGVISSAGHAAIEVRGSANINNIFCFDSGASNVNVGVRFHAAAGASPRQDSNQSSLSNFFILLTGANLRGIEVGGQNNVISNGVVVCTGTGNSVGVQIEGNATLPANGNVISNVAVRQAGNFSFVISDFSEENIIQGCSARDGTDYDFQIEGGTSVDNNIIQNCTSIDNGASAAFKVETGCDRNILKNNNIHGATIGIKIDSGATKTLVQGTTYENNTTNLDNDGTDSVIGSDEYDVGQPEPILLADAASVNIPYPGKLFHLPGPTTMVGTQLSSIFPGRRITLIATGNVSLNSTTNTPAGMRLQADFNMTAEDTIELVSDGVNWFEIGRSIFAV